MKLTSLFSLATLFTILSSSFAAETVNPFEKYLGSYEVISQDCVQDNRSWFPNEQVHEVSVEKISGEDPAIDGIWLIKKWDSGKSSHNLTPYPDYPWFRINGFIEGENFAELRLLSDVPFETGMEWDQRIRMIENEDKTFTLLESQSKLKKSSQTILANRICTTILQAK